MSEKLLNCQFCGEQDFDLIGLKNHLAQGDCEKYNDLPLLSRRVTPQGGQPAEPVEGAPALEKLIEAYEDAVQYTSGVHGKAYVSKLVDAARAEAANRRPATGEDERVAVLLSRLDAVCCILAIVDGPMPTKQELGMAYDELVSVRDDVAGIIRHLPAPSHSDVEPDKEYAGWSRADLIHRINSIAIVASFQGNAHRWNKGSDGDLLVEIQELAALNGDSK